MTRRYFDNAATTFPKPPGVAEAMLDYMTRIGASAGRGAYAEALESRRLLDATRAAVRRLFRAADGDPIIFALNGTDAINLALKGLIGPGDHVITTAMDHNSVLRPLAALERQRGVRVTIVGADAESTIVDPALIERAIAPATRVVVLTHASNVTGAIQPIREIAAICRSRGVPVLVDAAQSAGHVEIDFSGMGIDALAAPGHKGLLGPLGTGVLMLRAGVGERMQTVREGGTGSQSEQPAQPDEMPDKFEAGSHNAVGIAGLLASLRWIEQRGVAALREHERGLMRRMIAGLDATRGLRWFGPRDVELRAGVFSVQIAGLEPAELAALLEEHGILARSGLHCAPLAHRTIGTDGAGGTTRLSLGAFHTPDDIDAAIDALQAAAGAA